MTLLSRRNLLGRVAPAAALAVAGAAAYEAGTSKPAPAEPTAPPKPFVPTTNVSARTRLQQQHLPNIPLLTHEGQAVRFYDDLVKDKIVTVNFFYTGCNDICPTVTANLAAVQAKLGDQVGRDIFMYSFTLNPEFDDVAVIRQYRDSFKAGPGWTFLTGKPDDLEHLRKAIGFRLPDPVKDQDKEQHIGNIRYGNEPLMLWAACPGMAHPAYITETLTWMIHPDTSRIQPA
jgi:protein SCO1/2